MNGSVLAFAGDVVVVGVVLLVFAGATVLAGVVEVGVFVDFDGEVPLFGVVVVGVVGVLAFELP